jgi:hypothetical protein
MGVTRGSITLRKEYMLKVLEFTVFGRKKYLGLGWKKQVGSLGHLGYITKELLVLYRITNCC